MSPHLDTSTLEARYLLGELSQQEEEGFEKRYFSDDRLFEELQITEAEVIDAYVNNELSPKARRHVEENLGKSARLRERLVFARTFAQTISGLPRETSVEPLLSPHKDPGWKTMFAGLFARPRAPAWALAASVLVFLGVAFVIVQSVRLRNESRRLEAERASIALQREELARLAIEQRNQMASELQEAERRYVQAEALLNSLQQRQVDLPNLKPALASLTLMPGSLRSGGNPRELKLSPKTSLAQLYLTLMTVDYKTYRVVITGPDNKVIRKDGVKPTSRKTLAIQLPANQLTSGVYSVLVSGLTSTGEVETVNGYAFRVSPKP